MSKIAQTYPEDQASHGYKTRRRPARMPMPMPGAFAMPASIAPADRKEPHFREAVQTVAVETMGHELEPPAYCWDCDCDWQDCDPACAEEALRVAVARYYTAASLKQITRIHELYRESIR